MDDILKYAIEHGIIDISYVQEKIEMNKRKELLEKHSNDIWQGKDGFWRTYLPKENNGRRLIKKKNRVDLETAIIDFYGSQNENTFKKRFDVWVERQKICERSDNTICKYYSDYIRFFKGDPIESMDIRYITDEYISMFIKRLLKRKEIPYRALKSMYGYMSGVFKKSIIDKIIVENPCEYVDLPLFKKYCTETAKKTAEERTLSTEEKENLLNRISQSTSLARFAAELSLYTGMRVGELAALRWTDIDFQNETITIQASEKHSRITHERYISFTKNDKVRKIPLTENMKEVLKKTKDAEMERGTFGEFVFSGESGRIYASRIAEWVRNNTQSEQFINPKSIHAIRRTLNSNMKCNGVPTTVAAAILGHTEKVNEENYTYDVSTMAEKKRIVELAGKIG